MIRSGIHAKTWGTGEAARVSDCPAFYSWDADAMTIEYASNLEPFDDRERQEVTDYFEELGKREYLIYSHEHQAWWMPNFRGYTFDITKAGRYAMKDAAAIVLNHIPPGQEVAVQAEVVDSNPNGVLRMLQRRPA